MKWRRRRHRHIPDTINKIREALFSISILTYLQHEAVSVVISDPRVAREDVRRLVFLVPNHRTAVVQETLADLRGQKRRRVNNDSADVYRTHNLLVTCYVPKVIHVCVRACVCVSVCMCVCVSCVSCVQICLYSATFAAFSATYPRRELGLPVS